MAPTVYQWTAPPLHPIWQRATLTIPEREAHLCAEQRHRSGAGAVGSAHARVDDAPDQVQVLVLLVALAVPGAGLSTITHTHTVTHCHTTDGLSSPPGSCFPWDGYTVHTISRRC